MNINFFIALIIFVINVGFAYKYKEYAKSNKYAKYKNIYKKKEIIVNEIKLLLKIII